MERTESKSQQAYEITHELARVEDYPPEWIEEWGTVDVKLIGELATNENFGRIFYKPEPVGSIDEIRMEGLLSDFDEIDYIYSELRLPLMSQRMLSVLTSVKNFLYQTIPVVIEDTEVAEDSLTERSGKTNNNYVALQLLEHLDIFDREKSVYKTRSTNPNGIGRIKKLVLKVPQEGLPPIFRITDKPTRLYVSPEAKTALEEAEITGIRFVRIDLSKP